MNIIPNTGIPCTDYFGAHVQRIPDQELPNQNWLRITIIGNRLPSVTEMLPKAPFVLCPKRVESNAEGKSIEFDISNLVPLPDFLRTIPERDRKGRLAMVERVADTLAEHHRSTGQSIGPILEDYIFVEMDTKDHALRWLILQVPTRPRTPNDDNTVVTRLYDIAFPELRVVDIAKYKREMRVRLGIRMKEPGSGMLSYLRSSLNGTSEAEARTAIPKNTQGAFVRLRKVLWPSEEIDAAEQPQKRGANAKTVPLEHDAEGDSRPTIVVEKVVAAVPVNPKHSIGI